MQMTKKRVTQLERRLRRLRSHDDLWCGDPEKEARVTRLIHRCRKALAPHWANRPDFAGQRLLQMYA